MDIIINDLLSASEIRLVDAILSGFVTYEASELLLHILSEN